MEKTASAGHAVDATRSTQSDPFPSSVWPPSTSLELVSVASSIQDAWDKYCEYVRHNEGLLHLIDQGLSTLLFWTPYSSDNSRRREVLYGLVSVHHMLLDTALEQGNERDSYGTTVRPNSEPAISANLVRRLLTLTHSILPAVLEVSSQPSRARLYIERIKFTLRMVLLMSYWKQLYKEKEGKTEVVGLLRVGGMYSPEPAASRVPTVENQHQCIERNNYVGRRTGRRVVLCHNDEGSSVPKHVWLRLVLGELLHCYRPLFWAQEEHNHSGQRSDPMRWQSWLTAFALDILSLQCLKGVATRNNPFGGAEWSRRRLKLMLYLLRSPAWDRATQPTAERVANVMERVPLLGRLVGVYLRECLMHWKHPLFTEED